MNTRDIIRNVIFILLGALVFILKRYYNGPSTEFVNSYCGNVSISFSIYFLIGIYFAKWKMNKLITAAIALFIVELFEITNGFGIMRNVFDLYDFIANLVGVGLALSADLFVNRIAQPELK